MEKLGHSIKRMVISITAWKYFCESELEDEKEFWFKVFLENTSAVERKRYGLR